MKKSGVLVDTMICCIRLLDTMRCKTECRNNNLFENESVFINYGSRDWLYQEHDVEYPFETTRDGIGFGWGDVKRILTLLAVRETHFPSLYNNEMTFAGLLILAGDDLNEFRVELRDMYLKYPKSQSIAYRNEESEALQHNDRIMFLSNDHVDKLRARITSGHFSSKRWMSQGGLSVKGVSEGGFYCCPLSRILMVAYDETFDQFGMARFDNVFTREGKGILTKVLHGMLDGSVTDGLGEMKKLRYELKGFGFYKNSKDFQQHFRKSKAFDRLVYKNGHYTVNNDIELVHTKRSPIIMDRMRKFLIDKIRDYDAEFDKYNGENNTVVFACRGRVPYNVYLDERATLSATLFFTDYAISKLRDIVIEDVLTGISFNKATLIENYNRKFGLDNCGNRIQHSSGDIGNYVNPMVDDVKLSKYDNHDISKCVWRKSQVEILDVVHDSSVNVPDEYKLDGDIWNDMDDYVNFVNSQAYIDKHSIRIPTYARS